MQLFSDAKECCGCTACANICPHSAIVMTKDNEGFKYPEIDSSKCIECGFCAKVCSFQNGYDVFEKLNIPDVYAAKHISEKIRSTSTSGGAFTAISDFALDNSGVIYGAKFDNKFNVVHGRAQNSKERDLFKGSKYVQSDLSNIFKDIVRDLKSEKLVLFVGTPCQCGGLRSYLRQKKLNQSNLILIDFVCHGVPSPLIWKEHINFNQKKVGKRIKSYQHRSKVNGWHTHTELITYENGKSDCKSTMSQSFKQIVHKNYILRPSCYNCIYTNLKRCSDITIADFWGIQNHMPDFDDNKGISLMLINTEKGKMIFEKIKDNLDVRESNTNDCIQPQLEHPTIIPDERDNFWLEYFKHGYKYILKKYANCSCSFYVKSNIIKCLKNLRLLDILTSIKRKIR